MKARITRVIKKDKKDDGSPLKDKNGTLYYRVAIKIEGSDEWYSSNLRNQKQKEWFIEEGKEYSIVTSTSNPTADGKVFYNFKLLNDSELAVEDLSARVAKIESVLFGQKPESVPESSEEPTLADFEDEKF